MEATLFTLTGYLDWVNLDHVFAENAILLQMLCVLLEDSKLRLPACECLVILLERKVCFDFLFHCLTLYL